MGVWLLPTLIQWDRQVNTCAKKEKAPTENGGQAKNNSAKRNYGLE
jgi:hypothetical protein